MGKGRFAGDVSLSVRRREHERIRKGGHSCPGPGPCVDALDTCVLDEPCCVIASRGRHINPLIVIGNGPSESSRLHNLTPWRPQSRHSSRPLASPSSAPAATLPSTDTRVGPFPLSKCHLTQFSVCVVSRALPPCDANQPASKHHSTPVAIDGNLSYGVLRVRSARRKGYSAVHHHPTSRHKSSARGGKEGRRQGRLAAARQL